MRQKREITGVWAKFVPQFSGYIKGLSRTTEQRSTGQCHLMDVTMIRTATTAEDVEVLQLVSLQHSIVPSKCFRIASVKFGGIVQLSMTHGRGICAKPANATCPGSASSDDATEVSGMRAVDHEVRRVGRGGVVYLRDRIGKGLACQIGRAHV